MVGLSGTTLSELIQILLTKENLKIEIPVRDTLPMTQPVKGVVISLPLSSRQKGAADPAVYSRFNSALGITVCTTILSKILNTGLGLYVHIFREIDLLHV